MIELFEPGSISSSYSVIIGVRVVLKRTVAGDQLPDSLISFSAVQIYDLFTIKCAKTLFKNFSNLSSVFLSEVKSAYGPYELILKWPIRPALISAFIS